MMFDDEALHRSKSVIQAENLFLILNLGMTEVIPTDSGRSHEYHECDPSLPFGFVHDFSCNLIHAIDFARQA